MSTKYFDYWPIVGCTTVRLQTICIRNIRVFYSVQSWMVGALPCPGGNGSWLHQQLNSRRSHWRAGPYYGRLHESPKLTSTTNHLLLVLTGPHHCPQKPHHSDQKPSVKVSQAPKPQIKFQFTSIVNGCKAALRTSFYFWSPLL